MIENIENNGEVLAVIIRSGYRSEGVSFVTQKEALLQLGCMRHAAGYRVQPHLHNKVQRNIIGTQEVLFIKTGMIKIDFYSCEQVYLESRKLFSGDIVLLMGGGHGISILEETEMVEVKNGPYVNEVDKTRFKEK